MPPEPDPASRSVTVFEPVENGAGGLGERGIGYETLAVDVDRGA